ncbi:hypothetical protein [Leucobacter luti]|uniref:Uncharacterized protein n=1 Tax=Leucobacter luti TaxID=340320 RepID=A0A4R6S686_9MICO|nr:hypothetical protein [Leucobacter luti]QYM76813.1 hypothetical protein K1X41_05285 [Leucobacter luti]TDP94296.1 hypothetical protein EDF62_0710 [Leucobacter luti]
MTIQSPTGVGASLPPGLTVLTGRALHHLALGIVRDAARVPARAVTVSLSDNGGALRATVVVPVTLNGSEHTTLRDHGTALREALIQGMDQLAGRVVDTVDVRFAGVHRAPTRRVT